ncbi:Myosin catalytic light chain LC-1, mantle muscle isoform 3 [Octopus vulgaris]|uniref:Myosin catalytic light chain LC-1, mantle muscle isoform 3 n=1 Tax=Octopus vulgaris TaxID=6645 RepID=A0AA36BLF4_OCTVU|nr:Myosin catalytic light chain LC-1, mantle muscle isoform 3 [Octopus vulgaris]
MSTIDKDEVEEVQDVFDLFDFWDGRDGLIDAVKVGDLLRCVGLNPTQELARRHGGTKKAGEKQLTYAEFLACFESVKKETDTGTFKDFMEAFKSHDREGLGYVSVAELRQILTTSGERLSDREVNEIFQFTELRENIDGNVKYEDFVNGVLSGGKS